jgi:hypothetical protein
VALLGAWAPVRRCVIRGDVNPDAEKATPGMLRVIENLTELFD